MKDLQGIYKVSTREQAERNLDQLEVNWGARYPKAIESWRRNWPRLFNYFQYNKDIRRTLLFYLYKQTILLAGFRFIFQELILIIFFNQEFLVNFNEIWTGGNDFRIFHVS